MIKYNEKIFRAYDIRGIYGKDLTDKKSFLLGKSFGKFIGEGKNIVVSRDTRNSGIKLKKKFISGLISVGCNVIDIGITSSPMMYFILIKKKYDGGVSITASHNPAKWNGFKMTKNGGILCSEGMGMEDIKKNYSENKFTKPKKKGLIKKLNIEEIYSKFVLDKIKISKPLKIVLDPGNGTACKIAEKLFKKIGHNIIVINGKPDGSFPFRPSDPKEENIKDLIKEVKKQNADIGIAFDGDADRVAFVDNLGRYVKSGNVTIPIFSKYLISSKNKKIVYDICCSSYIEEFITFNGGIAIPSRVGHSYIMNKILEEKAVFGGEYSNHLYFASMFGIDDAIYAGLKMSEIVSKSKRKFSDIVDSIPTYPTSKVEEINCSDKIKFEVVKRIGEKLRKKNYRILSIDGIKAFDKENNWILIRPSNTMSMIKTNTEAKTEKKSNDLLNYSIKIIKQEIKSFN